MAQFEVVDLGTPDEKLRAVALLAAAELWSGRGGTSRDVLFSAQAFEEYLRTGKTR
jgi:hypothetical protein